MHETAFVVSIFVAIFVAIFLPLFLSGKGWIAARTQGAQRGAATGRIREPVTVEGWKSLGSTARRS